MQTLTDRQWKDLADDIATAFTKAVEKGGTILIKDMSSRWRSIPEKGDELLDQLKQWDRALWKRVMKARDENDDGTTTAFGVIQNMLSDAWDEAKLGYADSKDSRYNTDYDESVRGRMKALLGEGEPGVDREWEAAMDDAQKVLSSTRDELARIKKKMKASAPNRGLLNKFGPLVDKALSGVQDALDGFTY